MGHRTSGETLLQLAAAGDPFALEIIETQGGIQLLGELVEEVGLEQAQQLATGEITSVEPLSVEPSPIETALVPIAVDGDDEFGDSFGRNGEPAGGVEEGPFVNGERIEPIISDPGPDDIFPMGEEPAASETIAEKDAVSDGTQLPNGLPAGVGEQAFAGGSGGAGQGGSVSVNVEGSPQQTPVRQAGLAAGAVGLGLVAVVGVVVFAIRRGKR